MDNLITVVVLTYKNFKFLEGAIKSILNQSYSNIEVIVADDGSDNFNYDEVDSMFIGKKDNIKNVLIYSNEHNLGTVKSFNNAIKLSNGEIIVPLACDDELSDCNVITKIKEFFETNESLICTGKMRIVSEEGSFKGIKPNEDDMEIFSFSNEKLLKKMCLKNRMSGACVYYKKSVFERYGYFDEDFKLLEDYPFYLEYLYNGGKIGAIDYVLINYREGGISTSENINPILLEDFKNVYKNKIFKYKNKIGSSIYRECKLDYYRKFNKTKSLKRIFIYLKFIDIIIIKVARKLKERLNYV